MKQIRMIIDGVEEIHYSSPHLEFTLCCVGQEEDDRYPDGHMDPTNKSVDCEHCLAIVAHVRELD